jgi:hypothetical protein
LPILTATTVPISLSGHGNRLFLSQPGSSYREAVELNQVFKHEPLDGEDWPCALHLVI